MKKFWSLLIAAALVTLVLPMCASAGQTVNQVSNASNLASILRSSRGDVKIILMADMNASQQLTVNEKADVTLDLNGKTLNVKRDAIVVEGSLTILDSTGNGTISANDTVIEVVDDGSLSLESGRIESDGSTAVALSNKEGVAFNMTGGSICAVSDALAVRGGSVYITAGHIYTVTDSGAAIRVIYSDVPTIISIGKRGDQHNNIRISGISASEQCSLNIFSGLIGRIDGAGGDAVLECLFEQDVSGMLGSGWTCVPVEYEGGRYFQASMLDESSAAARIGDTYYADAALAAGELRDGQTLVLLKDVSGSVPGRALLEMTASNAVVELNGCSVTNTGTGGIGIEISAGTAASARIVNTGGPAEIAAAVPLSFSGAAPDAALTAEIHGQITLRPTTGAPFELQNALLAYSRDAADAVANGGFAATVNGSASIFTDAAEAAAASDDGSAVLLNDYSGAEQIVLSSGDARIDLDGHTYAVSGEAVIASGTGTELTVADGQIVGDAAARDASLTLDGVELAGGVSVSGEDTELDLTGCAIEDTGVGVDFNAAGGSLDMDDCSISASPALHMAAGMATISGDSELLARSNTAAVSADGGNIIIYSGLFVSTAADTIHVAGAQLSVRGGSFSSPVPMPSVAAGMDAVSCSKEGVYSYYPDIAAAEAADPDGVAVDISDAAGVLCSVTFDGSSLSGLPDSISVPAGASVKLPEAEREGIFFSGWYDGEEIHKHGELLTISADTVLTAVWSETDPDLLTITITESEHGSISVEAESAHAGDTVTVTAEPDDGYVLKHITVNGEPIEGTSFEMPDHDVELSAVFTAEHLTFDDVKPWEWYYECISYVCENGLMNGISESEFDPNGTMTRAMFWTVLARLDGVDTGGGETWFSTAQRWAMRSGVSDGTMPGELITREQLATMLWRYLGEPTPGGSLAAFSDAASVSDWARDAFAWAVGEGIVNGMTGTTLAPHDSATRAQAAAIFMRCSDTVA